MKQFFFMLSALAVTLPLSLSLQSCSSDDDDAPLVNNTVPSVSVEAKEVDTTAVVVDLGLSVKWANYNLGAKKPWGYGNYYAWGETESKSNYSWNNYLESLGATITDPHDCGTSKDPLMDYVYGGSKYNVATQAGFADGISGTVYDVAHVKLGDKWRMPTKAEFEELLNNCVWKKASLNGVIGCLVSSKTNGNTIFLPAAGGRVGSSLNLAGYSGYYWSATSYNEYSYDAFVLSFNNGVDDWGSGYGRYHGFSIRPVTE